MKKRTIKEHLNGADHIRIAQECMARLAGLLGCEAGTVKTKGNTSFIDFKETSHLDLPFYSQGGSRLNVWQIANKIVYTGIDESSIDDDLAIASWQLRNAGYDDAKTAVAAKLRTLKTVVFDISETGAILVEYSFGGGTAFKFRIPGGRRTCRVHIQSNKE